MDPYRGQPRFLLCPHCGEVLDRSFEGVSACLCCEGLWISPATLDAAFGNPMWPPGRSLWWRNAVRCPECVFEGHETVMSARMANDVIVDQCSTHGLWLDRGELGRLMGTDGDELAALRDRLAVHAQDLAQVIERRDRWRKDLELRRQAAAEYRVALEAEHRRREALVDTARARPPVTSPVVAVSLPAAETAARDAARREERADQRAQAQAELARLVGQLGVLQDHIQRLEAELGGTKHRALALERDITAARERLNKLG